MGNPTAVLALVAVAQFMVILDASVVNVAIPTIKRDLGFSEQSLSWILNAYTLMFGGFLLLGGRAADRLGRRRLFVAGITLFSAASVVFGLSRSDGMLLIARGAQGLGGALVSPAALSIILSTFAEGPGRNRALANLKGRELANRCEAHVRRVNFAAHLGADRVRRDRHLLFGFLRYAGLNL